MINSKSALSCYSLLIALDIPTLKFALIHFSTSHVFPFPPMLWETHEYVPRSQILNWYMNRVRNGNIRSLIPQLLSNSYMFPKSRIRLCFLPLTPYCGMGTLTYISFLKEKLFETLLSCFLSGNKIIVIFFLKKEEGIL